MTCFLSVVMMLGACTNGLQEPKASYDDFEHIEHWDDLSRVEGEFTIIYYYSPFCDICINLEDEVSGYLKTLSDSVEIFLIDSGKIYEQGSPDFEYRETVPALIIFEDTEFQEWIIGSRNVTDYLQDQINQMD